MSDQVMAVARFGMAYERQRLEAASYNLAIANTPIGAADIPGLRTVEVDGEAFRGRLGSPVTKELPISGAEARVVHDPANPWADENGNVRFPNVEPSKEMTTLLSATRAYEANVRAFNAVHQMTLKALEIGGRK